MRPAHSLLPLAVLLALSAAMAGCGSKDKGTNPMNTTEPFESGGMSTNGPSTFVHVFSTAGSFGYRCRIHGGMAGTINVTTGAADSAVVSIGNNFFNPTPVSIKPGGYARWVSTTTTTHTVTRP